jgi:hypothetical protein
MAGWSNLWLAGFASALVYCALHVATRHFSLARVLAVLRASLSDQSPIRYTRLCVALFARHYFYSHRVAHLMTSNQALQPTATRFAFTFFMTKAVPEILSRALTSRG